MTSRRQGKGREGREKLLGGLEDQGALRIAWDDDF